MVHDASFSFLLLYAIFLTAKANYYPFADDVQFSVNFPGPFTTRDRVRGSTPSDGDDVSKHDFLKDDESVFVMTQNNEQYRCIIPDVLFGEKGKQESIKSYTGPSERVLLNPLFEQSSCSYKIEPYWTYELCHGKYLRQYHEEKDSVKGVKLQEYYLGHYKKTDVTEESKEADKGDDKTEDDIDKFDESKVALVGGQNFPYYEVMLIDGTPCDLTGQPRKTSVRYICHELGRGEVYELKEISTCEYAVVILTQLLCSHPRYRPLKDPINQINCYSMDDAPQHPQSLVDFELENTQGRYNKKDLFGPEDATVKIVIGPDGIVEQNLKTGTTQKIVPEQKPTPAPTQKNVPQKPTSTATSKNIPQKNKQHVVNTKVHKKAHFFVRDFLSGEYCLQGGAGWWKHEYCHGRIVTQFHEERSGKIVIKLGVWDEEKHIEWLESNTAKMPSTKAVHLYYGNGDICDVTGKPRFVEVKLRCKESASEPNAVSIFLVESKPCEYNLVVESQLLCALIQQADEDGIIDANVHIP